MGDTRFSIQINYGNHFDIKGMHTPNDFMEVLTTMSFKNVLFKLEALHTNIMT